MKGSPVGEPSLILAIDFGTQSVRSLAYDRGGRCRAKHQLLISNYQHPESGWTEHDVEGFWTLLSESCQGLWVQGVDPAEIAAVVVTTQRATVINLDELGQPLRPAIIWTDQRRAPPRGRLPWLWRMLFTLLRIRPIVENLEAETEANWLERHQPEVLAQTAHFLLLSGYLNYRLTGVFKDSVGSQVGYVPFDFKKQDWCADSDWKWHSMAIKRYMLPALAAVGDTLGVVTADAAKSTGLPEGVPVIAGAADKACEVLGVGALEPGVASVSCGTTATINTTRPQYVEVVPFIHDMPSAYAASDLAICRAGALTVAEVTAVGLPCLFVPFPFAADNHQEANALVMVNGDAGTMVRQSEWAQEHVATWLAELAQDPQRRLDLSRRARALARPEVEGPGAVGL